MRPAIKKQTELFDKYSLDSGIDFTDSKDVTRQEFAIEADINNILNKFGWDTLTRPVDWGQEMDYDLDLSMALGAKQALDDAWAQLPDEFKQRYQDWNDVQRAYDRGEFALRVKPEEALEPSPAEDTKPE